jgi:hypothetical protein
MKRMLRAVLWCLLLPSLPLAAADPSVGRISSLEGRVLIDQFGKGAFIAAVRGDLLYAATVLKTPVDGIVRIELQGKARDIPPDAAVRVSDLLAAGARRAALPWFSAVGGLIRSFTEAARKKEETPTLGSRAGDASKGAGAGDMDWALDEADPARLLPLARAAIREAKYAEALATLARSDPATDPALAWDLSFWRGFCYFQLEDYADAVRHHLAAQAAGRAATEEDGRMLLFQLGSSYVLLGQEKSAIPPLESYMAQRQGDPYEPYAALTLARALAAVGEAAKARAVAEEGRKTWRGTALEKEFAALAP